MTQVVFSGATGTITNLNQNFTQLYDLRELISTTGYTATNPILVISNTSPGIVTLQGTTPQFFQKDTDAGADLKLWTTFIVGGTWTLATADDANTLNRNALSMTRTGYAVSTIVLGNTTDKPPITLNGLVTIPAPASGVHSVSGGWVEVGAGGIGYGTGSGGAVTQATSKSTGVTLNKSTGSITMNGAALNATTSVSFVLTNSLIAATDVVNVAIKSGATLASYFVQVDATAAGSCTITVRNYTAGNLSEAIVMSFAVLKGVAA
jgi:hypothetical protein